MRQVTPIILLFMFTNWVAKAQFVFFPGQVFDYGTVEDWHNEPAVFHLVNMDSKPLAILRLSGPRNILAEYPKTYIQPGDTGKIVLYYYTPSVGSFSESVEVSLSSSQKTERLTIKGRIKNLASDALTACPNDQVQGSAPNFYQKFAVLDEQTQKPIGGAHFFVGTRGQMVDEFKIPNNGKPVNKTYSSGMYILQIAAEGYQTVDTGIIILAGQRSFTFYLRRTIPDEPVVAIPPPPVEEPETTITEPAPVTPTPPVLANMGDSLDENPVLPLSKFKPNNIVFVLDVSSSMKILGRLDMLKAAMLRLTAVLRKADRVSIITFTTSPVTRIQGVSGAQKDTLNHIVQSLSASGATNGLKGLRFAYELAERHFIPEGNNIVIIGTDGVFSQTDENGVNIQDIVEEYLTKEIKLGVMAFGRDEIAIKSMEKIAAKGNGGFMRMDNPEKAPQLLLEQIQKQSAR